MRTSHPLLSVRLVPWLLAALIGALASAPVRANDRPFQYARTAVLDDDDDDRSWSFESWVQRYGTVRGLSVEPEYTFGGGFSVQLELGRLLDRHDLETGHEAEIEFKQLFNQIGSDGWAWGISAALSREHSQADGTVRALGVKLPVSISLGGSGGYLHLNPGIEKASGSRRAWTASAGVEREMFRRTVVFAEFAHEAELRFGQVGVRYWLKHEKLALDIALQQRRTDGQRSSGFIIGIGVYDF